MRQSVPTVAATAVRPTKRNILSEVKVTPALGLQALRRSRAAGQKQGETGHGRISVPLKTSGRHDKARGKWLLP